jgi:penicillin-binding protein
MKYNHYFAQNAWINIFKAAITASPEYFPKGSDFVNPGNLGPEICGFECSQVNEYYRKKQEEEQKKKEEEQKKKQEEQKKKEEEQKNQENPPTDPINDPTILPPPENQPPGNQPPANDNTGWFHHPKKRNG